MYLKKLLNSMPKRLQDVTSMEGVIELSTNKRAVHTMGTFQDRNCMNKELVKYRYTCGLIVCGAHCSYLMHIIVNHVG